jgi:hypothetical protein
MSSSRPNLGYSNMFWTKQITRKAIIFAQSVQEEEQLEAPIVLPITILEEKTYENIDRAQIKALADTFCPPRLTKPNDKVILYTSPQQGVSNE